MFYEYKFTDLNSSLIEFGKRLRSLREREKKTQQQIAEILNVTTRSYVKWENGDCLPNTHALNKLAEYYNVPTDYLLLKTDYVTIGNEAIQERTGLSATTIDYLAKERRNFVSAATYYGIMPDALNVGGFLNIGRILSIMIEISQDESSPDKFHELFKAISDYFDINTSAVETLEILRNGVAFNCTVQLNDLLRDSLNHASLQKQTEKNRAKAEARNAEIQSLYDAINPHKNSPEA